MREKEQEKRGYTKEKKIIIRRRSGRTKQLDAMVAI